MDFSSFNSPIKQNDYFTTSKTILSLFFFLFQRLSIYRDGENDIDIDEDADRPMQPEHREQNDQRQRVTQLDEVAAKVATCITTTTRTVPARHGGGRGSRRILPSGRQLVVAFAGLILALARRGRRWHRRFAASFATGWMATGDDKWLVNRRAWWPSGDATSWWQ